jgi:hypothetical protein
MAHYAKVESGLVTEVIVADSKEWCEDNLGGVWIQTSYNTHGGVNNREGGQALRKNYAGIGYTYDVNRDAFIPPKPDNALGLDEETCQWIVPKEDLNEATPE